MDSISIFFVILLASITNAATLSNTSILEVAQQGYDAYPSLPRDQWNRINKTGEYESMNETEPEIDIVQEILYFLDLGDKEIELTDHKDVTLIVGLSGSGKTTFLQFFANDTNRLKSVPTCDGCDEYILIDEGGYVTNQSLTSQTFLPHFLYNDLMDSALYDCPGFNDNRNASVEIANSFFIKKIANHAERTKIMVAAKHSSLDAGDRGSFPALMENLLILMKNASKFENSIALVGTKSRGGSSDSALLAKYNNFLTEQASDWINEGTWPEEKKAAALLIIGAMANTNQNGNNTNMGFFREPIEPGYLDEIDLFVRNKELLQDLQTGAEFDYVLTTGNDFGHSLSADAQLVMVQLVINISDTITHELHQFSLNTVSDLQREFDKMVVDDETLDLEELRIRLSALDSASYPTCSASNITPALCAQEISTQILLIGDELAIPVNQIVQKLTSHLELLRTAMAGLDDHIKPEEWIASLNTIKQSLHNYFVSNISPELQIGIFTVTGDFAGMTLQDYEESFTDLLTHNVSNRVKFIESTNFLISAHYNLSLFEPGLALEQYVAEIRTNMENIYLGDVQDIINRLNAAAAKIQFFVDANFIVTLNPPTWVASLVALKGLIKNFVEASVAPNLYEDVFIKMNSVCATLSEKIITSVNVNVGIPERVAAISEFHEIAGVVKTNAENSLSNPVQIVSLFMHVMITGYLSFNVLMEPGSIEGIENRVEDTKIVELLGTFQWKDKQDWVRTAMNIYTPIDHEKQWNAFLTNLFRDLTSYEIQAIRVGNLHEWWTTFTAVNNDNFELFWIKLEAADVSAIRLGNQDFVNQLVTSSPEKLNFLNQLLGTVLHADDRCPDPTELKIAVFQGNFLSLKRAIDCITSNQANKLYLLAGHTLFIDTDVSGSSLDPSNNVDLFTMSPRYYVRDIKSINLGGRNGSAGQQGGRGGTVLAIYDEIVGGSVTYSANGGTGGSGTDGGSGQPGAIGTIKSFSAQYDCNAKNGEVYVKLTPNSCEGWCGSGNNGVTIKIYGTDGSPGTNGSSGSNAGRGGFPGLYTIANTQSSMTKTPGSCGSDGVVGVGGRGGPAGQDGLTIVSHLDDLNNPERCGEISERTNTTGRTSYPAGSKGSDGEFVGTACTADYNPVDPNVKQRYGQYNGTFFLMTEPLLQNSFLSGIVRGFRERVSRHQGLIDYLN